MLVPSLFIVSSALFLSFAGIAVSPMSLFPVGSGDVIWGCYGIHRTSGDGKHSEYLWSATSESYIISLAIDSATEGGWAYFALITGYIGRIRLNGTDLDETWLLLDGSSCGTGHALTMAFDDEMGLLYFQTQHGLLPSVCRFCSIDPLTRKQQHHGDFGPYGGGGAMNGQLVLFHDHKDSLIRFFFGVDSGEIDPKKGCFMKFLLGETVATNFSCGLLPFPRGLSVHKSSRMLYSAGVDSFSMVKFDFEGNLIHRYDSGAAYFTEVVSLAIDQERERIFISNGLGINVMDHKTEKVEHIADPCFMSDYMGGVKVYQPKKGKK